MAITVVRLGTPRKKGEGIRLGTVRRPPRGVRKVDYARLDYFDAWLPQLAPSAELVGWIKSGPDTPSRWAQFGKRYLRELSAPDNARLLDLLCAFSKTIDFSVGCYCEDEATCHRSVLRRVLQDRGALVR